MIVNVEMLAFPTEKIYRLVDIPLTYEEAKEKPTSEVLELVFTYGQNYIQPKKIVILLSVGDVIELFPYKWYVVTSYGFKQLTREELREYKGLSVRDRYWKYFSSQDVVK